MSHSISMDDRPLAAASVRLTRREYTHLLAQLDRAAGPLKPFAAGNRRIQQRIPFHREARFLCRFDDGTRRSQFSIRCRNICKRGLGFLHGAEIEPGTRCELTIISADRQVYEIAGVVVRSRVIGESIHEIGVRFDLPIHLEEVHPRTQPLDMLVFNGAPTRRAV